MPIVRRSSWCACGGNVLTELTDRAECAKRELAYSHKQSKRLARQQERSRDGAMIAEPLDYYKSMAERELAEWEAQLTLEAAAQIKMA